MNFQLQVPASSTDKIPWPTGFSDTLRGEFAGKTASVFIIDDDGASSKVESLHAKVKALTVEPINYDNFMKYSAEALDIEADLSILVSALNMEYREATSALKRKHSLTYLKLTDTSDPNMMGVTAAKARATALCAEEEINQQQTKKLLELYAPLQERIKSTKQYISQVLRDLNNQR